MVMGVSPLFLIGQVQLAAPFFDTALAVSKADIDDTVHSIRTGGYASAGDGGEAILVDTDNGTKPIVTSTGATTRPWYISGNTLKPEMFGIKGDGSDETDLLQRALDCATILRAKLVQTQKIYISTVGITVSAHANWVFNDGASLELLPHNASSYQMIRVPSGASDIILMRPRCDGRRDLNSATGGEHGMGLSLRGCKRVKVVDAEMKNCWGDGIYIGSSGSKPADTDYTVNENITIVRPITVNNRRQGISVISGINLVIDKPTVTDTNGTAPQCGIDIEPNNYKDVLKNIRIRDVTSARNVATAVKIELGKVGNPNMDLNYPIDIQINGINSISDHTALSLTGLKTPKIDGKIAVSGLISFRARVRVIDMRDWCYAPKLSVDVFDPEITDSVTVFFPTRRENTVIRVSSGKWWKSEAPLGGLNVWRPVIRSPGKARGLIFIKDYGESFSGRAPPRNISIIDPIGNDALPD